MRIRPAAESDVPSILSIINFEIENSTAIYDYEPRTMEMQLAWFHNKQSEKMPVVVAEDGGDVMGFATYGIFRPKEAYRYSVEHSIYLDPVHRGRGVGSQLMHHLIELARASGCHIMIAGVDASNQASYHFHRKLGFIEVAHFKQIGFKFDRWLDLIFMQLFLDEKYEKGYDE